MPQRNAERRRALARLVHGGQAALVVVDMQNDFCHPDGALGKRGADLAATQAMVPTLERLIAAARAAPTPIIYTANAHDSWSDAPAWTERQDQQAHALCRTGSWGAEFYAVRPQPGERVLVKHRYNAFVGTDFDLVLRSRGIGTLIFSGVATNVCVESTARDAFARNYRVVMIGDCLAGSSPAEHAWSLRTLERYFGATLAEADEVTEIWAGSSIAVGA